MEGSRKKEKWNRLVDAFSLKVSSGGTGADGRGIVRDIRNSLGNVCLCTGTTGRKIYKRAEMPLYRKSQCLRKRMGRSSCQRVWDKRSETSGRTYGNESFREKDSDCIAKAQRIYKVCGCPLLEAEKLTSVLLSHELFHAVEERYEKEIYTRTEKVELWRRPFSNRSSIICLSEIAAMAFAAQMTGIEVSPYMLDVLLVYAYDQNAAWGLYEEVCSLRAEEQKLQEKRENKNTCLD